MWEEGKGKVSATAGDLGRTVSGYAFRSWEDCSRKSWEVGR